MSGASPRKGSGSGADTTPTTPDKSRGHPFPRSTIPVGRRPAQPDSHSALGWGFQRRLHLLQPEPHAHLVVHRRGGGQMLARLRAVACAVVELAETKVAVGDERAH